eukprot:2522722-Alexandrium_andersonii.AAC.1
MSASLVGSEMCIRDRLCPMFYRSDAAQNRTNGTCARARAPVRSCMRPVSYTHLTLPTICSV